jgi:hypothetical protein
MELLYPIFESDESYKKSVEVDLYYKFNDFLGKEIDLISCGPLDITFNIYIGYKSWGIKEVSIQ